MSKQTKTILIVEDDTDLQEHIRIAAENRLYLVLQARNGLEAKKLISDNQIPDLVILDINMPGMDGYTFCRWLRDKNPLTPVIFLSARADEYNKIIALEIGGDDYLTKPFSMKELFSRIEVCLRRIALYSGTGPNSEAKHSIVSGELSIDCDSWTCVYRGIQILLTISEFRILKKLLENQDIVLKRETLAEAAFPEDKYNLGRSIDVHICRIRQKLQDIHPGFNSIETVYQVGYKWKN